ATAGERKPMREIGPQRTFGDRRRRREVNQPHVNLTVDVGALFFLFSLRSFSYDFFFLSRQRRCGLKLIDGLLFRIDHVPLAVNFDDGFGIGALSEADDRLVALFLIFREESVGELFSQFGSDLKPGSGEGLAERVALAAAGGVDVADRAFAAQL